jgi:hypothetical protein
MITFFEHVPGQHQTSQVSTVFNNAAAGNNHANLFNMLHDLLNRLGIWIITSSRNLRYSQR